MEKVVYTLWRRAGENADEFCRRLRTEVAPRLLELGARAVQVNVADSHVVAATGLYIVSTRPQMEATLNLWVDTAIAKFRRRYDEVIEAAVGRMAAYLVTESQPIVNTRHPPVPGERTAGFSQLAFLKRPPRLTHEAWLDVWHNSHTQVAIDTQSTFLYVQNVVVRSLTHGVAVIDGIVEEGFPAGAMNDPQVFFDAVGDPEKLRTNVDAMMASCARFIDNSEVDGRPVIDVVPTSQYVIKPPAA
jgi:hypothetical protein